VDYVALADPENLAPLGHFNGRGRLLAAARLGRTRLIDNIPVELGSLGPVPAERA
jgi:pantoate--beta-alanine ligase